MKRVLFLAMVIVLVGGFAIAKMVDTPITVADLKDLKGEWTGERTSPTTGNDRTDLKIYNDSLPLQGDLTLYYKGAASRTWPCGGRIENGRLKLFWDKKTGSADLGLRKADDGSMELRGTGSGRGYSGPVVFKKVK